MTSITQLTVPNFSTPMRSGASAAAGPASIASRHARTDSLIVGTTDFLPYRFLLPSDRALGGRLLTRSAESALGIMACRAAPGTGWIATTSRVGHWRNGKFVVK